MTKDTTKGATAMIAEPPVVKLRDEKIELRRLGIKDTYKISNALISIMKKLKKQLGHDIDITKIDKLDKSEQMQLMTQALLVSEDEVIDVLAHILDEDVENIVDPNKYPPETPVLVFKALYDHPDITAFINQLKNVMGVLQK